MYNKSIKHILTVIMTLILVVAFSANQTVTVAAAVLGGEKSINTTVICIDPGHGGITDGAKYEYDGVMVKEKDINLAIALKLREELEQYEAVEVIMTRTTDVTLEINPRIEYAVANDADYLISIHNNAAGGDDPSKTGCMVLSTVSHYQAANARHEDIYGISEKLSLAIVDKLTKLGIPLATELGAQQNGVVKRPYSPEGQAKTTVYYPDMSVADYYGLIRSGIKAGLPTIIIEHAYLSSEQDYRAYLKNEESIAALAKADAEGIAEALGLVKKQMSTNGGTGTVWTTVRLLPITKIEKEY